MARNRPGNWLYADLDVLRGVTLALKQVDKEAKKEWAKSMRTTGTRVWRSAVSKRQTLAQDDVFGRASVRWSMTGKGVAVVKAKPLSGTLGDAGGRDMRTVEFGSKKRDPRIVARYRQQGRVAYAALEPFGKYMGQMSVATVADLIREATGGD